MYLALYEKALPYSTNLKDCPDEEVKDKFVELGREISLFDGDDISEYYGMANEILIFPAKHYVENPDEEIAIIKGAGDGDKIIYFIVNYFLDHVKPDTKLSQRILKEAKILSFLRNVMDYICVGIHTPFIYQLFRLYYDELLSDFDRLKNGKEVDWFLNYPELFDFVNHYDPDLVTDLIKNIGEFALTDTEICGEGCCNSWNFMEKPIECFADCTTLVIGRVNGETKAFVLESSNDKWMNRIKEILSQN